MLYVKLTTSYYRRLPMLSCPVKTEGGDSDKPKSNFGTTTYESMHIK